MSAHYQTGSISADLVTHREIEERIGRARAHEMVRAAKRRPAGRQPMVGLNPVHLLSRIRVALSAPVRRQVRQALGG